ncbi:hypothetical protein NDU88_010748 [Pleurodeles waltl]|uniref:Uncharacterized protein n=1 Tax=Pleurodeles waltl TaxID=8319 RepID=A0AAV7S068_PLEWA|nr:hypothetical protein NDU88_010748 [Pleurodeles waltl]
MAPQETHITDVFQKDNLPRGCLQEAAAEVSLANEELCDRESSLMQEINGLKSPDPSFQSPKGTSEVITSVHIRERTDIEEGQKRTDHEQGRREDADLSRTEERRHDEEGDNQCRGDDEE